MSELVALLNQALEMEHAAAIQYYTHAEQINGPESGPLMEQLQEQAGDEQAHAVKVRTILSDYLKVIPTMGLAPTKTAANYDEIISRNILSEQEAIDIYRKIFNKICEMQDELGYRFESLRFDIDEILREEQEHITQLERVAD